MRRCVALVLAAAMIAPLGEGLISRALVATAKAAPVRKQSVVVFDFVNRNPGGEGLASTFTRDLRLVMEQSSSFDLMTFSIVAPFGPSIDRAIREQRVTTEELAGPFDPDKAEDKERAVKIASILGADLALMGSIGEGDYEYVAAEKRLRIEVTVQAYRSRGAEAELGQLVQAVSGKGEGKGEGMQGALEDQARRMAAKDAHDRLAGIQAAAPKPERPKGPRVTGRWVWYIAGALGVVLIASMMGKKGKPGPATLLGLRTEPTGQGVRLTWVPSTDPAVSSYEIYRAVSTSGRQVGDFQLIKQVSSDTAEYLDEPLDPTVGYLYAVVPVSADGKKGSPVGSTTVVVPGQPTAVAGMHASVDQRTVQLTWTKNPESFVTGYRIYRSDQMNGGFVVLANVGASQVSYVDATGLAGGITYFYKVTALGPNGQESDRDVMAAVPASTDLKPSVPKNVRATATVGQRSILLTWDANPEPDVQYYQIYRGLRRTRATGGSPVNPWQKAPSKMATRGGPYQIVADRLTTTSYTDTSVEFNNTYYYVVKAVASGGDSLPSEEVSGTPDRIPAAVQNARAEAGDGVVTVRWAPVAEPDIVGYNIYRETVATATAGTKMKLNDVPLNDVQYADRSIINDTQYRYFVTAVDGAGYESAFSLPAGPVIPTVAPSAPTSLVATAGNSKVTLVWNRVVDANLKEYRVYRSDAPQLEPQQIATVAKSTSATVTFTDTNVQNLVTYYYQVTAVNSSDVVSGRSMPTATATPGDPPAAPGGVTVTPTDRSVIVQWSPVTHYASSPDKALPAYMLKGYRIYRTEVISGVRTMVKELLLSTLTTPSYEDTAAPQNVQLQYGVSALMPDASGGVLESEIGVPADQTPVIVMRRLQAPTGVTAQVSENGSQVVVNLSWTAATDPSALGYVIYGATSAAGPYNALFAATNMSGTPNIPAATPQRAVTSDEWTAMRTATRVWFRVATVSKLGIEGFQSDPPLMVNLLPPPQNLQAVNSAPTGEPLDVAIDLTWLKPLQGTVPQNIVGYRVYRSDDPTTGWQLVTATPLAPALSMSYRDLFKDANITLPAAIGRDFYYQVVAVIGLADGSTAESRPVATALPTTVLDVPPPKVQGVTTTLGSGVVTVRWQAVKDAQGNALRDLTRYTVYRREKNDLTGATEVQFNVTVGEMYRDTDTLISGLVYTYRVRAFDYSNAGELSDVKEVTIP